MSRVSRTGCAIAALALIAGLGGCAPRHRSAWDPRAAATYLDGREAWWAGWTAAARDQHTFCISCHTALPYALARPVLQSELAEAAPARAEQGLLDDVSRRVRLWRTIQPYYPNKPIASRGTEAVLNAVILAGRAAALGHLDADSEAAFQLMWTLQDLSGANAGSWPWIQFNNEPWEAPDSRYYGAVLAAIAVGLAPDDYRSRPAIQEALTRLRGYLERDYAAQTPINRIALLWASARWPELMSSERRLSLIAEIGNRQRVDGGWALASLVGSWKRRDGTAQVVRSDGYATGLITLALRGAGVSPADVRLQRALAWLASNQEWDGHWSGFSLNKARSRRLDPAARFMDDAATAYAVLALARASRATTARATAARETTAAGSTLKP